MHQCALVYPLKFAICDKGILLKKLIYFCHIFLIVLQEPSLTVYLLSLKFLCEMVNLESQLVSLFKDLNIDNDSGSKRNTEIS